jgi:ABC-type multidrug transport system fused ATPase/permease subunit
MWRAMTRAKMAFFNTTPMGRVTNRLSKDVGDTDRQLMNMTSTFVSGMVQLFGALVIIGVTTYYTLAAFVPVLACFFWVQRFFQATSREVKRLDSVTRSPIYSHFSQCLNGLSSIRAYGAQGRMVEESGRKLDANTRMSVASFSANRWLSIRLEFLGGLMVFAAAVFAVAMRKVIGPEEAALSLSYALQITGLLNMTTRLASLAENSFNAVERLQEYAQVEPEAADEETGPGPPPGWPSEGAMVFDDVVASYRPDLPPVLRGLSFTVKARQKVGVVGRTGAGKSSLFLALFRIVEPSSGTISIDGVDLQTLGLSQLRRKLSIIPQDPVLFSGTVKGNLDPFGRCTDSQLWKALEMSHMDLVVGADASKLMMPVSENGDNFSVGQRQLLCLARALLRKSKVLVLDEATAAVDADTDALIQSTIRAAFADCATLTIAHRLNTIIDSDLIVVLDAGGCHACTHARSVLYLPPPPPSPPSPPSP